MNPTLLHTDIFQSKPSPPPPARNSSTFSSTLFLENYSRPKVLWEQPADIYANRRPSIRLFKKEPDRVMLGQNFREQRKSQYGHKQIWNIKSERSSRQRYLLQNQSSIFQNLTQNLPKPNARLSFPVQTVAKEVQTPFVLQSLDSAVQTHEIQQPSKKSVQLQTANQILSQVSEGRLSLQNSSTHKQKFASKGYAPRLRDSAKTLTLQFVDQKKQQLWRHQNQFYQLLSLFQLVGLRLLDMRQDDKKIKISLEGEKKKMPPDLQTVLKLKGLTCKSWNFVNKY